MVGSARAANPIRPPARGAHIGQIGAVAGDLRQQRRILEEFLSAGPLPADVITTAFG